MLRPATAVAAATLTAAVLAGTAAPAAASTPSSVPGWYGSTPSPSNGAYSRCSTLQRIAPGLYLRRCVEDVSTGGRYASSRVETYTYLVNISSGTGYRVAVSTAVAGTRTAADGTVSAVSQEAGTCTVRLLAPGSKAWCGSATTTWPYLPSWYRLHGTSTVRVAGVTAVTGSTPDLPT